MAQIQTHPKMADEILTIINDSENVVQSLINAFKIPYFKGYVELSVNDKWSTIDVNTVKFAEYGYHRSMAGAMLLNRQTWNIMNSVIMNPDAKDTTKTVQFKALAEMLYADESKALMAVLNKNIASLYPNITFEKINEALSNGS